MNLKKLEKSLKDQATARVMESLDGADASDRTIQAHISLEMGVAALRHKDTTAAILRKVVAQAAKSRVWAFCKVDPARWPNGFTSVEDFVTEMVNIAEPESRNVKTELTGLGIVVAYADQNCVEMDGALATWSRLRIALPVLKEAAGEMDADRFEDIVGDVQSMTPDKLRGKYTTPRNDPAGLGAVFTTDTGQVGAVIIFNHDADRERFVRKQGGVVLWGLEMEKAGGDAGSINLRVPLHPVDETVWAADKQAA